MTRWRPYVCAFLTCLLYLAVPNDAAACTCVAAAGETAWPTLDETALTSDAVVVGRVTSQITLVEPQPYEGQDVGYLELKVLDGISGVPTGAHLRVWDAGFGSSCSVDLRPLRPGVVVALALERNGSKYKEYQDLMKLPIAPDDYLLRSCGDYHRRIDSDDDVQVEASRLRDALREGRRTRE